MHVVAKDVLDFMILQSTGIIGLHHNAQYLQCWGVKCKASWVLGKHWKLNYAPRSVSHFCVTGIISVKAVLCVLIWMWRLLHSLCVWTRAPLLWVQFWEATEALVSVAWLVVVNHQGMDLEDYSPSLASGPGSLFLVYQNVEKLCKLLLPRTELPKLGLERWLCS